MNKQLTVVIPHYRETEDQLFPLLCSIRAQVGIDFSSVETLVVNDAGTPPGDGFLSRFGAINPRCIKLGENGGPGLARQAGLEAAKGDYIMFCDADDTLHNVAVLAAFMQEMRTHSPDIIASSWLEELPGGEADSFIYLPHDNEATWMHGKVFRRDYLQRNNLHFHPNLRVHEDSYFLALAFEGTGHIVRLPFTSYVWRYNPGSITRRGNAAYTRDSAEEFIRAITLAFEVIEQKKPNVMPYKVLQFILYHYFTLHGAHWLAPESAQHLRATEAALADRITPFLHHLAGASADLVHRVYNEERTKSFAGQIERETLGDWLSRIGITARLAGAIQ